MSNGYMLKFESKFGFWFEFEIYTNPAVRAAEIFLKLICVK